MCVFVERENLAVVFKRHTLRISCHKGAGQLSNDSTEEDNKSIADRGFNTDMSSLVKGHLVLQAVSWNTLKDLSLFLFNLDRTHTGFDKTDCFRFKLFIRDFCGNI